MRYPGIFIFTSTFPPTIDTNHPVYVYLQSRILNDPRICELTGVRELGSIELRETEKKTVRRTHEKIKIKKITIN